MPLFSVVVPAFNVEAYIGECLDSLAAQTSRDYEAIVIDDGSRDGTAALIERWRAKNTILDLRVIRQENKGIGAARNTGIAQAAGDFVAFLDADDTWLPRKLERVAACLSSWPDADLVCHDEWIVKHSTRVGKLRHGPFTAYEDLLFKRNCVSTSATVVRRRHLNELGGFSEDLQLNGVEDYDLWLRLANAGCRFAYLHETLGCYRIHQGATTSRTEEHCEHSLHLLAAHFKNFSGDRRYLRLMRCRRGGAFRSAARELMRKRDGTGAWRWLWKAMREDPLAPKTWALLAANAAGLRP
jgi:cellulose synthase/poly-beta-1,6-N-acetylglucosamine synthase-like glycosyltransferase